MKEIRKVVKLKLIAGKASAVPPLGPILSQNGVNVTLFCKDYNQKTMSQEGKVLPVKIFFYEDKTFDYIILNPPTSYLILKALSLEKGSKNSKEIVGFLTSTDIEEISKIKFSELNTNSFLAAKKIILGTAKNMGILTKD
jgi:large subunit ribosomal protein L11